MLIPHRRQDGPLVAPPAIEPTHNPSRWNAVKLCPLGDASRFTAQRDEVIISFIPILFCVAGPLAIAWFVTLVILDPLQRAAIRPRSHVGLERGELVPAVAYGDPSTAVSSIGRAPRIKAPGHHPSPRAVLWSPHLLSRVSVCHSLEASRASATRGVSHLQVRHGGLDDSPASALARPDDGVTRPTLRWHQRREVSEVSTCNVGPSGNVRVSAPYTRGRLTQQASATARITGPKRGGNDGNLIAAGANTSPFDRGALSTIHTPNPRSDSQAIERLTYQVQHLRHAIYSSVKTALMLLFGVLCASA